MFRHASMMTLLLALPTLLMAADIPVLGTVLGPGGEAISKAEVRLEPIPPTYERAVLRLAGKAGPEPVGRTRTGVDGTFQIAAPEAGMWKVVVSAPGMLSAEHRLIPLVEETVLPAVEMTPAADLEVRLVDAQGKPRPGAVGAYTLGIRGDSWRPQLRLAVAGEDGVAHLPLGRDERIHLEVLADGHPLVVYEVIDESSVTIDLPVGVAGTVRIIDQQKRSLAAAVAFQGSALLPLGLSDEDGRLPLVLQAKGAPAVKVSTVDRWNGSFELDLAKGEGEVRDLRLDPPTTITGRILDFANQDPVAGAMAWAVRGEPAITDKQGRYTLEVGVYKSRWLQAAATGYLAGRGQMRDSESGEAPAIALTPSAALTGKVVDEAGKLLEGVAIDLRLHPQSGQQLASVRHMRQEGWRGRTSRRGAFRVTGLPAEIGYELRLTAEGFAPQTLSLDPLEAHESRPELEIVMRPGRLAFGRVVDADEAPVAGAQVSLKAPPPTDDLRVRMYSRQSIGDEDEAPIHFTDAEGRFEIADLAVGRYDLEVRGTGYAPAKVPGVRVDDGDGQVDFGTVMLVVGASIEGRVTDPDGGAIAGAEIFVDIGQRGLMIMSGSTGQEEAKTQTAADGRFIVSDLMPGQLVTISVTKKGFGAESMASLKPPIEEPLAIVMRPAGRILGRVVDGRGEPIRGANVMASLDHRSIAQVAGMQRRRPTWASTGADGRFLIEDVEPGQLQVRVNAESYQQLVRDGVGVGGRRRNRSPTRARSRRGRRGVDPDRGR